MSCKLRGFELLKYGVIGSGRWGSVIKKILSTGSEMVISFDISRRHKSETRKNYKNNIKRYLQRNIEQVDVIWIAVPPKDQDILIESVLDYGKHVIVEKPWMCDQMVTSELVNHAKFVDRQVAVHYQYCYLDALKHVPFALHNSQDGMYFWGEFCISRSNRLSIPAIYNLGTHLLAIKELYFPDAFIKGIHTGYNMLDKRRIRIQSTTQCYEIDFQNNNEPLIQRFIFDFENHLNSKKEFPLNLMFSLNINKELILL